MLDYRSIVVLTGAGISAESGLKTFRDNGGIWEEYSVFDVATPEAFESNPDLVQRFYNERRQSLLTEDILPNRAHIALAEFEASFDGEFTLITQNVDDLHERGGSENLIHMHGELLKIRCIHSQKVFSCSQDVSKETECVCCGVTNSLRPHVVWFGEMPLAMERIEKALSKCDLFIAIGTSGQVYPAAGFSEIAKSCGAYLVEINLESTGNSGLFNESILGAATEKVPQFFDNLTLEHKVKDSM